jgi:tape measure domain-containing protein
MGFNAGDIFVKFSAKFDGLERDLAKMTTKLDGFSRKAESIGRKFTAAVTLPLIGGGAAALKLASDFEQSQIAFTNMLGSAEKAKSFLNDLTQFAAKTPFEIAGLEKSSKLLLAFGFESKQILPMMQTIGDAVSALGLGEEGINRVTIALGQMQAKGKVSAQEVMQLAEAGIPAWDMLAKKIGVDIPTAMKLAENNAISSGLGISAILEGMNNKFNGMMQQQSGTLGGLWSNFKDTITITLRDIGKDIVDTFDLKTKLKATTEWMQGFSQWFKDLDPEIKKTAVSVAGLAAALGPILLAFRALSEIIKLSGIAGLIKGIKELSYTLAVAFGAANNFGESMKFLFAGFKPFLIGGVVLTGIAVLVDFFVKLSDNARIAKLEIAEIAKLTDADKKRKSIMSEVTRLENRKNGAGNKFDSGGWLASGFTTWDQDDEVRLQKLKAELKAIDQKMVSLKPKNSNQKADPYNTSSVPKFDYTMPDLRTKQEKSTLSAELVEAEERYEALMDAIYDSLDKPKDLVDFWAKKESEVAESMAGMISSWNEETAASLATNQKDFDKWAKSVKQITTDTYAAMETGFSNIFVDAIKGKLKSLADYLQSFADTVLQSFSNEMAKALTGQIQSSAFGNMFSNFVSGFGGGGAAGAAAPAPGMAAGGATDPWVAYKVNELGKVEGFKSNMGGRIMPLGNGGGANVQVNVINNTSERVKVKEEPPQFDGKTMIKTIILESIANDDAFRTAVQGAR